MEGAALRREQDGNLLISHAWHSAVFSGLAQSGKLKGLSTYTGQRNQTQSRNSAAEAAAFFHRIKASGIAVEIKRVPRRA